MTQLEPTKMLTPVRALIVCVDYADLLRLTLPHNMPFFSDSIIVTTYDDKQTRRLAQEYETRIHLTDVFYKRGAYFNKFAAIEEGLDVFGRQGWILLIDADIAIPKFRHPFVPHAGLVYTPYRRILKVVDPVVGIPEQRKWAQNKRPRMKDEQSGYFQLFHGSDRILRRPPWHSLDWTWSGASDAAFQDRWPAHSRVRPPFEVLHLGEHRQNWAGRVTPFLDGTLHPKAVQHQENMDMLMKSRVIAGSVDIYAKEKLYERVADISAYSE